MDREKQYIQVGQICTTCIRALGATANLNNLMAWLDLNQQD